MPVAAAGGVRGGAGVSGFTPAATGVRVAVGAWGLTPVATRTRAGAVAAAFGFAPEAGTRAGKGVSDFTPAVAGVRTALGTDDLSAGEAWARPASGVPGSTRRPAGAGRELPGASAGPEGPASIAAGIPTATRASCSAAPPDAVRAPPGASALDAGPGAEVESGTSEALVVKNRTAPIASALTIRAPDTSQGQNGRDVEKVASGRTGREERPTAEARRSSSARLSACRM